jgi:hypothetical protein
VKRAAAAWIKVILINVADRRFGRWLAAALERIRDTSTEAIAYWLCAPRRLKCMRHAWGHSLHDVRGQPQTLRRMSLRRRSFIAAPSQVIVPKSGPKDPVECYSRSLCRPCFTTTREAADFAFAWCAHLSAYSSRRRRADVPEGHSRAHSNGEPPYGDL